MIQSIYNITFFCLKCLTNLVSFTFFISVTLCILSIIYLVILAQTKRDNYRTLKDRFGYPVPDEVHPFFGHIDMFASSEYEFKWHKQLGKLFGFYYGDAPQLKTFDLGIVNEIFLKQNRLFNARHWNEYRMGPLLKSILFNRGNNWRKMRRLIQPALAQYRIRTNDTAINDIQSGVDKLVGHFKSLVRCEDVIGRHGSNNNSNNKASAQVDANHLNKGANTAKEPYVEYQEKGFAAIECNESPTGWAIEMNTYDVMQVVTIDVIYRVAFNKDTVDVTKGTQEPSLKMITFVMRAADKFIYKLALTVPATRLFLMPYMWLLDETFKKYRKFTSEIFEYNKAKEAKATNGIQKSPRDKKNDSDDDDANDLCDSNTNDDNFNESNDDRSIRNGGQPKRLYNILLAEYEAGNLSRSEVMSNTLAICVAGFETTATTSTYVLWCIAKHKEHKARLRADILSYGVESKYLDMFIKEVMRMYPALPNFVARTPQEDTKVASRTIKRGMSVYLSVNSMHYDESIWPNPYQFDPERFAEGKTYPPAAYAPFGLGHRMCAGYQLAQREMKTIVCELMANFDIHLVAPADMIIESSSVFLSRPKHEVRIRLIPNAARHASLASSASSAGLEELRSRLGPAHSRGPPRAASDGALAEQAPGLPKPERIHHGHQVAGERRVPAAGRHGGVASSASCAAAAQASGDAHPGQGQWPREEEEAGELAPGLLRPATSAARGGSRGEAQV